MTGEDVEQQEQQTMVVVHDECSGEEDEDDTHKICNHAVAAILQTLDPPLSRSEKIRDQLLKVFDTRFFQILGVIVLVAVVVDGAVFFFMLMGWQSLCDEPSPTNCEPRNQIYNISVQILTALFTYMATESIVWRCANLFHVFGVSVPRRSNETGRNLYGISSPELWWHIPLGQRRGIILCFVANSLTQYFNQLSRIAFNTYETQGTYPGTLWTNLWFGMSMFTGFMGAVWLLVQEVKLKRRHPSDTFPPGIPELTVDLWKRLKQKLCGWQESSDSPKQQDEKTTKTDDSAPVIPTLAATASPACEDETNNELGTTIVSINHENWRLHSSDTTGEATSNGTAAANTIAGLSSSDPGSFPSKVANGRQQQRHKQSQIPDFFHLEREQRRLFGL